MQDTDMNYVVGRGRLFFGQFFPSTRKAQGQDYFGNTPALSLSQAEDSLDHYSSEGGVRVKDASVSLQNDSSGSFQCDNISLSNLALWFRGYKTSVIQAGSASATGTITFSTAVPIAGDKVTINGTDLVFVAADADGMEVQIGATIGATASNLANAINDLTMPLGVSATVNAAVVTIKANAPGTDGNSVTIAKTAATPANITVSGATLAGGADVTETITNVSRGKWYQLGETAEMPQGIREVGSVSIDGVADDSIILDAAAGRFYINPEADDVVDGDDLEVSYGLQAGIDDIVISRTDKIEGSMTFLANNAAGANDDYYWPYVRLMPDGDLSLKGDEWMSMTFNFEVLKRDAITERQYITRRRPKIQA
jgi:hypothetical protein